MDYLQIANSWPVWLCAGACVAFIVVQAVAFAKLCYKNAPLVGLSKADCSKSFQCGMVTAIGPSLSCFIGAHRADRRYHRCRCLRRGAGRRRL